MICKICSNQFEGASWAKYCPNCKRAAKLARDKASRYKSRTDITLACAHCNKPYTWTVAQQVTGGKPKYCSDACHHAFDTIRWREAKRAQRAAAEEIRLCEFDGCAAKLTKTQRKYCTLHAHEAYNQNRNEYKRNNRTPSKPGAKFCVVCETEFQPSTAWQLTCSDDCKRVRSSAERAKKRAAVKNVQPKDVISIAALPPRACVVCGTIYKPNHTTQKVCGEKCRAVTNRESQRKREAKQREENARRFVPSPGVKDFPGAAQFNARTMKAIHTVVIEAWTRAHPIERLAIEARNPDIDWARVKAE